MQDSPSDQLVVERHNLRSRENFYVPARYLDDQKQKNDESIGKLKIERSGKKSSITIKINQLNKLIEERGSRTKLKFLMESCWKLESIITDLHEQPKIGSK